MFESLLKDTIQELQKDHNINWVSFLITICFDLNNKKEEIFILISFVFSLLFCSSLFPFVHLCSLLFISVLFCNMVSEL